MDWIKARIAERTSWDGMLMIAFGLLVALGGPMPHIAAMAAIGWGAYTLMMHEKNAE